MPTTNNRNFTLTTVDSNVTVNVTYNVVFTAFERHLAGLGMAFQERIRVLGVDPAGSTTGTVLHSFPVQNLPVTDGSGTQTITRNRSISVSRASLQEDPAAGDADEILCRIEIAAVGLPPAEQQQFFTDQSTLLG